MYKKNGKSFFRENVKASMTMHMKIWYGTNLNSDFLEIYETFWPPNHNRVVIYANVLDELPCLS